MTRVDRQARELLERWAATPSVAIERLTATAVRHEDLMVLDLQATPDRLHAVDDIEVPGPASAMTARVYRPRAGRLQTVLYLHGGGFVIGPEGYEAPLRQLALSSGCLIVALRYRLAPEQRFPPRSRTRSPAPAGSPRTSKSSAAWTCRSGSPATAPAATSRPSSRAR
jgi:acetyl esterase